MKILFIILSLFLTPALLAKPPGSAKEHEQKREKSQGRNSHNHEFRPHKKAKPTIPKKGSLWKFKTLKEDALFIVVDADEETISYKKVDTTELPTKRPTVDFFHHFKPAKRK